MQKTKRILIFNVNWLGDVLFSTAAIRNIRRNFPASFIACVIPSRCYQVLKGNPHLDEIIIFEEKDRHKKLIEKMNFINSLKYKNFDTAILLHGSFTRALICRMAEIPERIGYNTKKRGFLLTKKITPPRRDSLHRIDYYLNILEKSGIRVEDRYLEFFVSAEDRAFSDDFLKKHFPQGHFKLVGINPGGNWMPKRWPSGHWAELADKLQSELGAKVIITGSQSDFTLAKEIAQNMKAEPMIAAGALNLKQAAALFEKLNLFISGDSGPLHIANAVGAKKIIALFGPTSPDITGPFPLNNVTILKKDTGCKIPCYIVNCKDNRCMKEITPQEVFEQAKTLLGA